MPLEIYKCRAVNILASNPNVWKCYDENYIRYKDRCSDVSQHWFIVCNDVSFYAAVLIILPVTCR